MVTGEKHERRSTHRPIHLWQLIMAAGVFLYRIILAIIYCLIVAGVALVFFQMGSLIFELSKTNMPHTDLRQKGYMTPAQKEWTTPSTQQQHDQANSEGDIPPWGLPGHPLPGILRPW